MNSVGFVPQGTFILLAVPKEAWDSSLVLSNDMKEIKRKEWIEKGGELVVVEPGADCRFVKRDDKIMLSSRGIYKVELESGVFYIARESDILGKFE